MSRGRRILYWSAGIFSGLLAVGAIGGYQQYAEREAERKLQAEAKRLGFSGHSEMEDLQKAGFQTGANFRSYAATNPLSDEGEFAVSCAALFRIWGERSLSEKTGIAQARPDNIDFEMWRVTNDYAVGEIGGYLVRAREAFQRERLERVFQGAGGAALAGDYQACKAKFEPIILAKQAENEDESASPTEDEVHSKSSGVKASPAPSGGPMVNVGRDGWIIGRPFHTSNSSKYYRCDGVISPEFHEVVFRYTTNLSKEIGIATPVKELCSVSQADPGSIAAGLISVNLHISASSMRSCTFTGRCDDFRTASIVPSKTGAIRLSFMVTKHDELKMNRVCVDMQGNILSTEGCPD